jgi:hypothetical protein
MVSNFFLLFEENFWFNIANELTADGPVR